MVVHGLSEGMARRGHEVLVLTASDLGVPYTDQRPGLRVERCRSFHNPLRRNHKFSLWPHAIWLDSLRNFQPDVIHVHDPFQSAFFALEFKRLAAVPVLMTTHQLPWYARKYLPGWKALQNGVEDVLWGYSGWLAQQCDGVISPSATVAEVVWVRLGVRAEVISYGVDPRYFYPAERNPEDESALRTELGLRPGVPLILYVGRLDVDKNVATAVRAALLAMRDTPADLLVVGDGTQKANLRRLAAEMGMAERCHFCGYIADKKRLGDVYRLADVFVSASEIETQGLVFYEAVACALPLVAVRATCIAEIVHDEVNGFLAEPGDVAGLAARLVRILHSADGGRRLGLAGVELAQACSLERTLDLHEAVYAGVSGK